MISYTEAVLKTNSHAKGILAIGEPACSKRKFFPLICKNFT